GDLDNDGWPDLVVSYTNSPVKLLRNEAAAAAPNHWLGVRLVGRDHRDVVGSTVVLEGETRKLTRFAKGGGSYLSAGDPRLLFGLGASLQARRVTVRWSWGESQTWDGLRPDRYYELREGQAKALPDR
ncbi:MAG TPA: ASPIC/UnbV domain-containing protein, partial [Gemmataceae bacterium]|nr:ASPIC/UnbV domain-containing protein [Gemmataceae bacterium]